MSDSSAQLRPVTDRPRSQRRSVLLLVFGVLGLFLALWVGFILPLGADAASSDTVDSWTVTYEVTDDGVVHVSETVVYRFGLVSGRHGMVRTLLVREPISADQDAIYTIKNLTVTSEDASDDVTVTTSMTSRNEYLSIMIGAPYVEVTSPTATYQINYDIIGAIRPASVKDASSPELSHQALHSPPYAFVWQVLTGSHPQVDELTIEVRGAVTGCQIGSSLVGECVETKRGSGSDSADDGATDGGDASGRVLRFSGRVASDSAVTVSAPTSDAVVRSTLDVARRGDWSDRAYTIVSILGTAIVGAICLVILLLVSKHRRRDYRFVGVQPGVIPANYNKAKVCLDHVKISLSARPRRPQASLVESCALAWGEVEPRDTAAAITDLACRGALQLVVTEDSDLLARPVNRSVVQSDDEKICLDRLFGDSDEWVLISEPGQLRRVYEDVKISVANQVVSKRWFADIGVVGASAAIFAVLCSAAVVYLFFSGAGGTALLKMVTPLLPMVGLLWALANPNRRGRRSALGRAITDQVMGYAAYLDTKVDAGVALEGSEYIWAQVITARRSQVHVPLRTMITDSWLLSAQSPTCTEADVNFVIRSLTRALTPVHDLNLDQDVVESEPALMTV